MGPIRVSFRDAPRLTTLTEERSIVGSSASTLETNSLSPHSISHLASPLASPPARLRFKPSHSPSGSSASGSRSGSSLSGVTPSATAGAGAGADAGGLPQSQPQTPTQTQAQPLQHRRTHTLSMGDLRAEGDMVRESISAPTAAGGSSDSASPWGGDAWRSLDLLPLRLVRLASFMSSTDVPSPMPSSGSVATTIRHMPTRTALTHPLFPLLACAPQTM